MRERRDQLDQALDDALASYGEAPEKAGLERRVLLRVTERAARARSTRPLTAAMAIAAIAVCCLFWWAAPKPAVQTERSSTAIPAPRKVEAPAIRTVPARRPAIVLASAAKPRRRPKQIAEPKLQRFPTPFPVSIEERALLQLVTRNAKYIPSELTYFGGPIKPIEVKAFEIKPLD